MNGKKALLTLFVAFFILVVSTNYKLEAAKTHKLQNSDQVQVLSDNSYAGIKEKNNDFKLGYYDVSNFELRPNYIFKVADYMSVNFPLKYDFQKSPLKVSLTDKFSFEVNPDVELPNIVKFELVERNTNFVVRITDLKGKTLYYEEIKTPKSLKDYKVQISGEGKAQIGRVSLLTKASEVSFKTNETPISVKLDRKELSDKKKEAKRVYENRKAVYKETMPRVEVTDTKKKTTTKKLGTKQVIVNDKDVHYDYNYGSLNFDFAVPYGPDNFNVATNTCDLFRDQVIMLEKTDCFNIEAIYEEEAKDIKTEDVQVSLVDDDNFNTKKAGEYEPVYELKYADPVGNVSYKSVRTILNNTRTLRGVDYGDAPNTYGTAGTNVDDAERYQLGKNDTLFTDILNVDIESTPQYSATAKGDDTTGRNDEDGIYNHPPGQDININTADGSASFAIPYNIASASTIGTWLDDNKNGKFDNKEGLLNEEGEVEQLDGIFGTTAYSRFNIDFSTSSLVAGNSTFLRVRIAKGVSSLKTNNGPTDIKLPGETEDYKVNFYSQNNSEIKAKCNGTYATSNEFAVLKQESITDGVRYTFNVGNYRNATMDVTSPSGIKTTSVRPLQFESKNDAALKNEEITIKVRDANGNRLYLPLNFSFWNPTAGYGTFKVGVKKLGTYQLPVTTSAMKLNSTTKVTLSEDADFVYASSPGLRKNDPDESFLLQKDTLAAADFTILEVSGKSNISVGLNMNKVDTSFDACTDDIIQLESKPQAYIEKYDAIYPEQIGMYNKSTFTYYVDNVEVPAGVTKMENLVTIPKVIEWNPSINVKVYTRLKGSGNNYVLVPASNYSHKQVGTLSTVLFTGTAKPGNEYRFVYELKTGAEFNKNAYTLMESSMRYTVNSTVTTVPLNVVHMSGLQPFMLKFTGVMGQNKIGVESTSSTYAVEDFNLEYSYKVRNCPSCAGFTDRKPLTSYGFNVPISDKSLLETTDNGFGNAEIIDIRLYDGKHKVHTFSVKRWYPTRTTAYDVTKPAEKLNPIAHYYHVTTGIDKDIDIAEKYAMESFERVPGGSATIEDGKVSLKNLLTISNKAKPIPSSWTGITQSQVIDSDYKDLYTNKVKVKLYFPSNVLDKTFEAPTTTINGKEYKEIAFNMDKLFTSGEFELAGNYIVEKYSGRLYNKNYGTLATPTTDKTAIRNGANDASDVDLSVNGSMSNQFLLDPTSKEVGKDFTYYFTYYDYGLNQIQLREGTTANFKQKNIGYFKKHSKYYFKANLATEYEANCIKYNICKNDTDYAVLYEGRVTAIESIRDEVSKDHTKLRSYKGGNDWLDKYIEQYSYRK